VAASTDDSVTLVFGITVLKILMDTFLYHIIIFQLKENLVCAFTPSSKQNPLSEIYPPVNIMVTSVELKQWEMEVLYLSQLFLLGFLLYLSFGNKNLCITRYFIFMNKQSSMSVMHSNRAV